MLIPNEEFGRRKFINVGLNRSVSSSRIEEISRNHTDEMRAANKQWIHPPEALLRGHILYNVKFLGECQVDCPKGTDVVKDAIRKRKFNKHIQKAEGQRTPRVELCISVDGVSIQDPKTKIMRHQYPLHRISYCADDKSDRRMLTFIAKAADTNEHFCYVFASEKSAEEITLTIGQAFDLAYRRFLDTQGKDMEQKKQNVLLQKKIQTLERENEALKLRIRELEMLKDRGDIENYKKNHQIGDLASVGGPSTSTVLFLHNTQGESSTDGPEPGKPVQTALGVGLESMLFEPAPQTNGTDAAPYSPKTPTSPTAISPPPPPVRHRSSHKSSTSSPTREPAPASTSDVDELASVFHSPGVQQNQTNNNNVFNPFETSTKQTNSESTDPFGMSSFNPSQKSPTQLDTSLNTTDRDFLDLQAGFSQGLSFGTEEFGMEAFDPLNQSNSK